MIRPPQAKGEETTSQTTESKLALKGGCLLEKIVDYITENTITIKGKEYTRDFFIEQYINQNTPQQEMIELLGISDSTFCRILSYFHLKKTKTAAGENYKKNFRKKYGVDSFTQMPEYKEKLRETCLKKYGCEHFSQSSECREKFKETCLEKYGVSTTALLPSVIEKRQQTCLEKYGAINPAMAQVIKDKMKTTVKQKYGVEHYSQTEEFKTKLKATTFERYGVEYYSQSEECKEKIRETATQKYGVLSAAQSHFSEKAKLCFTSEENFRKFLLSFASKPTVQEVADILEVAHSTVYHYVIMWGLSEFVNFSESTGERQVRALLESWGIKCQKTRKLLDNYLEIDMFCPDYNIGIEYNGVYWHSTECVEKKYHYNKSLEAEKKGIRLIHIYEYEWQDPVKQEIIKSLLRIAFGKVEKRIYARNCEVREISNAEAAAFNNKNHLQGHRNAQITLGLFFNEELVQLMSFSKTKYNLNLKNDNEWEIIRGCPGSNNLVVGGVSKLLSAFKQKYAPSKIFSYCDFNKFDGKGYESAGMHFCGYTGPDMKWVLPGWIVVPRKPKKHKELKQKALKQIWGAGSKKYVWYNNENCGGM